MKEETELCSNTESEVPDPATIHGPGRSGFRGLILIASYLLTALLSLWVSGPLAGWPVIWLPYGVALTAFLTYGRNVWAWLTLGAILASILQLQWLEQSLSYGSVFAVISGEALGVLAGPGFAAFLIHRWTHWPNGVLSESGASRFYLLGGLMSGLGGAIAVTAFWIPAGVASASIGWFFFENQALGRALGAIAVAPLLLGPCGKLRCALDKPTLAMQVPRLFALAAVLGVLCYVSSSSVSNLKAEFEKNAFRRISSFERLATAHLESLKSIRSLWDSSAEVDPDEFHTFVDRPLKQNKGFESIIWAPSTHRGQESASEKKETSSSFAEKYPDSAQTKSLALTTNGSHFPVLYAEPPEQAHGLTGFDLATVEPIASAIELVRNKSQPKATIPFTWKNQMRVAVLQWIDRKPLTDGEQRSLSIHDQPGIAIAILNVGNMLEATTDERIDIPMDIALVDFGANTKPFADPDPAPFVNSGIHESDRTPAMRPSLTSRFDFAGRIWMISATSQHPTIVLNPPRGIIVAQSACFILVTLLGILLMSSLGRNDQIKSEVNQRTAELAESQERFIQLADNIGEAFWITHADGEQIEYLSPGFETIWLQSPPDTTTISTIRESVHPDDFPAFDRRLSLDREHTSFDVDYRIHRPDGSERWIRDRGFTIQDPSGRVIRMAGVADDTTEQRRAAEKIIKAKQSAEEAGALLKAFFRVSLDMLCVAGTDGFFKRVNPAFSETLGYPDEQLLSRPFVEFVHPDDVEETVAVIEALNQGESIVRFANRYRSTSGRYVWLEWNAVPDSKGELIYAAARNITERKHMEEELRRSNAELEQFAYIASHDLQEPLRMVTSFVQLLKRRYTGKLDQNADEYIHHIVDGSEKMRQLILALLELSRIDKAGEALTLLDPGKALDAALENLTVSIAESGAKIHREKLPEVIADREQLTRLFQNLISNAIKYSGNQTPEIRISSTKEDDCWVFSVADNGPGIDPAQRNRVFQIFQRLHNQKDIPGTGIGLAICSRIIQRHHGTIRVERSDQGGANFVFTLPVIPPSNYS